MNTIKSLELTGHRVEVTQLRYFNRKDKNKPPVMLPTHLGKKLGLKILPRGGLTVVVARGGDFPKIGAAECSDKDNFDHKIGLRIALQRLVPSNKDALAIYKSFFACSAPKALPEAFA